MIKWTEEMSVHIDEIDAQHQEFVKIINELDGAIGTNGEEMLTSLTLIKLQSYAQFHFATEERYFKLFKYPDAEQHARLHRDLLYRVQKLSGRYFGGGEEVVTDLVKLLTDWLGNHLELEDKKYAKYFIEHGYV